MRTQATRANRAQIEQHIRRQRLGIAGMEFAHRHPIIDGIGGGLVLALGIGGMFGLLIAKGAGLL